MKHLPELIKITENEQGVKVVSARHLYEFLEVKTQFTIWCNRMFEYGMAENVDYVTLIKNDYNIVNKSNVIDYALTFDSAKEISMLQRTEKGKQARLYFIEMEKVAKQIAPIVQTNPFSTMSRKDMLLMAIESEEEKEALRLELKAASTENESLQIVTNLQKKQLQIAAPKMKYIEDVLTSHDGHNITIIAKELNTTPIKLNKWLKDTGVQFLSGGTWVLKVAYQNHEYTKSDTHPFKRTNGEIGTHITTKWTEKGRLFIHGLWNSRSSIA